VLSNTNRLHFAEQIPQLAKSQTEPQPLGQQSGIQDKDRINSPAEPEIAAKSHQETTAFRQDRCPSVDSDSTT
jgi:hypothetical protein